MNRPHQRVGAISNAHVGEQFEKVALDYFRKNGIVLTRKFSLPLGIRQKKQHCFDLGSSKPPLLVECKSHRWTEGGKVPSAKMTVWNEAMLYFQLAPKHFRKVLFVLHDKRPGTRESLVSYYRRIYAHLIPEDVEFLEFDEATGDILKNEGTHSLAVATEPASSRMINLSQKAIVEFVRKCGEIKLRTLQRKQPFIVRVEEDDLNYVPVSGKLRRDMQSAIQVCEEFNRTNSWNPGNYAKLTLHASYTLALIEAYLKSKGQV